MKKLDKIVLMLGIVAFVISPFVSIFLMMNGLLPELEYHTACLLLCIIVIVLAEANGKKIEKKGVLMTGKFLAYISLAQLITLIIINITSYLE